MIKFFQKIKPPHYTLLHLKWCDESYLAAGSIELSNLNEFANEFLKIVDFNN